MVLPPDEMFRQSLALLQAGQAADAERSFKALLQEHPTHAGALNLLAILTMQTGRLAEAEDYARRALNENPKSDVTLYNYGLILKSMGRPAEALERFSEALAINPAVPETWNNRGVTLSGLKRHRDAIADFDRALSIKANYPDALCNKAKSLAGLRLYDQALTAYDKALALNPALTEAWIGRGNTYYELRRYDDALGAYGKAAGIKDDLADAWLGRGNVYVRLRRYDDALAAFDTALATKSGLAEAWLGRGNVNLALKRHDAALDDYGKALQTSPDFAEAWLGRGNVSFALDRPDEAQAAYDKALALNPELANVWVARGNVFAQSKRIDKAGAAYDTAIELKPTFAEAWVGRANVLSETNRLNEASTAYDRALALERDLAEAWQGQGNLFLKKNKIIAADAAYSEALAIRPDYAEAWIGKGIVSIKNGQPGVAVASFDKVLAIKPDAEYIEGARLIAKLQLCDWTNFESEEAHLLTSMRCHKLAAGPLYGLSIATSTADQHQYAKLCVADRPTFAPLWHGEIYTHDRIRVAYVSSDLLNHPVGGQLVNLLERNDRSRFEITAVSLVQDRSSDTQRRIESAVENYVDAQALDDREVADLIRRREIDIAIDLNGFTDGQRPNIFALKPAPVQINYLGYAGTLGADYYDYIIADRIVLQQDQFEFYSEKVVWLPDSFMASDAERQISGNLASRGECGLPESGFVFCCFNAAQKILPSTFQIWTRLLKETPSSVLWLPAGDATMMANLRREIEQSGVSADRLIFAPRLSKPEDHLARLRLADLFLDTLPYNAHTTASDALWAGLPVVTCLGSTFAGRVAASLLNAAGLNELVTANLDDYQALALKLARDPALFAALKAKLARERATCPLFDTPRFTRHIESAYVTMWERYQRGKPPASFAVAPAD